MLHIEDNTEDYGQRIFGFIHPPRSDSYLFGIASDDSSELWLSPSEDPRDKQLIARVFDGHSIACTKVGQLDKYSDQVSKTAFKLERGKKYYIEVLHKADQGRWICSSFLEEKRRFEFQCDICGSYLDL